MTDDVTIPPLTPDEARQLTEQIKVIDVTMKTLIGTAYLGQAWVALDYASWDAYCDAELSGTWMSIPREERRELVFSLRDLRLSLRAIASATGQSKSTVQRELSSGVPPHTGKSAGQKVITVKGGTPDRPGPQPVIGIDGKNHPLHPVPKPALGYPPPAPLYNSSVPGYPPSLPPSLTAEAAERYAQAAEPRYPPPAPSPPPASWPPAAPAPNPWDAGYQPLPHPEPAPGRLPNHDPLDFTKGEYSGPAPVALPPVPVATSEKPVSEETRRELITLLQEMELTENGAAKILAVLMELQLKAW